MAHGNKKPFATLQWNKQSVPFAAPASLEPASCIGLEADTPAGLKAFDHNSHLVLGENLGVMQALLKQYENSIDLIYCDPLFSPEKPIQPGLDEMKTRASLVNGNLPRVIRTRGVMGLLIWTCFFVVYRLCTDSFQTEEHFTSTSIGMLQLMHASCLTKFSVLTAS